MTSAGPITRALAVSLKAAQVPDTDAGAVALARRYAALLDAARGAEEEPAVLADLGPKYQAVLTALGLTKAGRGVGEAKGGTAGVSAAVAKRDELKERRARRGAG